MLKFSIFAQLRNINHAKNQTNETYYNCESFTIKGK